MAFKNKSDGYKYQNEFNRAAYDRITILVAKGCKDAVKALATEKGISVNEYIKQAIKDRARLDGHKIDL